MRNNQNQTRYQSDTMPSKQTEHQKAEESTFVPIFQNAFCQLKTWVVFSIIGAI